MNNNIIEFEKIIFDISVEIGKFDLESDRRILKEQYDNCIHNIEITGAGFYDNIIVPKDCKRLDNENFSLGGLYIKFINSNIALSMEVFIKNGYINLLEFYTYEEEWNGEITNYEIYEVTHQGNLSFIKTIVVGEINHGREDSKED